MTRPCICDAQPGLAWACFRNMRNQGPQPDERQPDKIGKEQRRHGRSAVDDLVKEIAGGLNQIRLQVKPEPKHANGAPARPWPAGTHRGSGALLEARVER